MKKLLVVSFIALSAVSAANADVASVAYVQNALSTKQNAITTDNKLDVAKISGLATVATSGSYNDLSDKPTIPTVPTNVSAFNNDAGYITSASIPAQVQADWTATEGSGVILNKPTLATVATSGSYNDLTNKPTIPTVPTDVSAFNNDAGYITSADVPAQVQANWTESDDTKASYIANKPTLATVATSGSYNDLTNTPTIDSALSNSSTNAVQNKVVKAALDGKQATISDLETIRSGAEAGATALQAHQTITTGGANGTIAVAGSDVAVKGLGSAAYTASTDYATSAQGALADTALQPNTPITPGTATKVTYDANGLITAGTTLSESDIPAIPESRVTNLTTDLTNAQNKIPSGSEGATTLASVWLE